MPVLVMVGELVGRVIDDAGRLRSRWQAAMPSEAQKAAAAAKLENERLSKEAERRDADSRKYALQLFDVADKARANEAFRDHTLGETREDNQTERSIRLANSLIGSSTDSKTKVIGAQADANIRRDTNLQEFTGKMLGQLGDQEIRIIDRFIGQTPLADNYFSLERDKLALARQAYADSMKPLTFWENIGRVAPALTATALALFG